MVWLPQIADRASWQARPRDEIAARPFRDEHLEQPNDSANRAGSEQTPREARE